MSVVADLVAEHGTERALVRRRRRDGRMLLEGDPPPWRPFHAAALLDPSVASVASVAGDEVRLEFADAAVVYRIVERRGDASVVAVLVSAERFDPPPVDEHRAFELQLERRDREVDAVRAAYGVDEETAERIAVDHGRIPPRPSGWEG